MIKATELGEGAKADRYIVLEHTPQHSPSRPDRQRHPPQPQSRATLPSNPEDTGPAFRRSPARLLAAESECKMARGVRQECGVCSFLSSSLQERLGRYACAYHYENRRLCVAVDEFDARLKVQQSARWRRRVMT